MSVILMVRIVIFLFCMSMSSVFAQRPKKIDSLKKSLALDLDEITRMKTYKKLFTYVYMDDPSLGKVYLDSFETIALRNKELDQQGAIHSYYASYYTVISDQPNAAKSFKAAIKKYEEYGDHRKRARAINRLGGVLAGMQRYDEAMELMMESAKILDSLQIEGNSLGRTYGSMGKLHGELGNYELSNTYFKKAEAEFIAVNDKRDLSTVRSNIAKNMRILKKYDSSLLYYKKIREYYIEQNYLSRLAKNYNYVGLVYGEMDSLVKAQRNLMLSLEIAEKQKLNSTIASVTHNLAEIAFQRNEYGNAKQYLTKALSMNKELDRIHGTRVNYSLLAKVHAATNDFEKAYEYETLHFKIHDSIFKKESVDKVNQLEIQYQTEKKEAALALQGQEIETLNGKVEVQSLTKKLYGIGMVSFLVVAGLLYFGFKQRIKKNRIARDKQEAIYKQEIEFKKKELASQTLHLVQKSTFIQELTDNLVKLKESPELFKIEFRRLILLLKRENAEDKDWEVFKSYFSEVHNNFDLRLKEIYADISEKEIRLASFLRMNLSTKEIASMLNVLPDSVLKSKYRLKKKLNLSKEEDLSAFLDTL